MLSIFPYILAILAIAAASVYAIFARDLSVARAGLVGRSQTMDTSFGALEYATIGMGEPVLTIHGAGGGFDQSIDITGALAERGYRLIAPSRFGYLGSALPADLTTAMQADANIELLDRLDVDKAFVIAISAGAWSAIQFAIRHPERCRAVVFIIPADFLPSGKPNHGGAFVRAMIGSDFVAWAGVKLMPLMPGAMMRMMLGTDPALLRAAEPSEQARVRRILKHLLPVSARFGGMQFDIKTAASSESDQIEKITCPVLAISAQDDKFGTAARAELIAGKALNGKTVIFPTGDHALVGRHADAMRAVTSFLRGVKPALVTESVLFKFAGASNLQ